MMHDGPSIQNYVTPWYVVRALEADTFFRPFALDAAADRWNAKAERHYNRRQNGKKRRWLNPTFYNPEYSEQAEWLARALFWARRGIHSAGLLKLATSESYWRPIAYEHGTTDLYDGRLAFLAPRGGLRLKTKQGVRVIPAGAPVKGNSFASAVVLLGPSFAPRAFRYRHARTGLLIHHDHRKAA